MVGVLNVEIAWNSIKIMEIKKSKVSLFDIKFLQKYLSFEEACKVLAYASDKPLSKIFSMNIFEIVTAIQALEKSKKLDAKTLMGIHMMIQRDDEKARGNYFTRLFRAILNK